MLIIDAFPLILLARIELLDSFLAGLATPAIAPPEVTRECYAVKKTSDSLLIQRAFDEFRIRLDAVRDRKLVAKLADDFRLGQGEAEAIALVIIARRGLSQSITTAPAILVGSFESDLIERDDALRNWNRLQSTGDLRVPFWRTSSPDWRQAGD
jgi:hypothetical protein